jgi:hypothetical protein
MPSYKNAQNVIPHNFALSVLKINDIIVNGLDLFSAEQMEDSVSWEPSGDGLGQFVIDPSQAVIFKFTCDELVDSTNDLWDLQEAGTLFTLSFLDPNAPNFNCKGDQCLFAGRAALNRDKAKPRTEWTVICGYGKMRGGSFTLATP